MIGLDVREYFYSVILRCIVVALTGSALPIAVAYFLNKSILSSMFVCSIAFISALTVSFVFGMTTGEKIVVLDKVRAKFQKVWLRYK